MLRMLMRPISDVDGNALRDSDDDDNDEDEGLDHRDVDLKAQEPWDLVREAVASVQSSSKLVHLRHPSKELFIFRRRQSTVLTRLFTDTRCPFRESHLRPKSLRANFILDASTKFHPKAAIKNLPDN
jgi:hypothetical protein